MSYSRLTTGDSANSEGWQVLQQTQQRLGKIPGQNHQETALKNFNIRDASCTIHYSLLCTTGMHMQNYIFPASSRIREYPERLFKLFRSSLCTHGSTSEPLDGFSCNSIQEGFGMLQFGLKPGHPT
jgi:hypothetical protein